MLELDDIQHYLLTRPNATVALYNFLTFSDAESAKKWIADMIDIVGTAKSVSEASDADMRWVTLALTFNGLRKIGVDEDSLSTFPDPFKQGMAARSKIIGDIGANHPDNWEEGPYSEP